MEQIGKERETLSRPFLTRYASKRTLSPEIKGYYSPEIAMWVVSENGVETPLIDCAREVVELVTKTSVQKERDDQENIAAMVELETKTDAKPEHDNADISACLEVTTKTHAMAENDDDLPQSTGLFL